MKPIKLRTLPAALVLAAGLSVAPLSLAEEQRPAGLRWEITFLLSNWPSLADLDPFAGGSFAQTGFGIGGAVHWPTARYARSELLLGVETSIIVHDSDVPVGLEDFIARDVYLGVSAKWLFGELQRTSLDVGVGYHMASIAEFTDELIIPIEFESWNGNRLGASVGATWDQRKTRPGRRGNATIGFTVHFVDFGTVRDEGGDFFSLPLLGDDAGTLGGPVYVLRAGFAWR